MTLIGVNELGLRVGQYHHNAKLTDAEVELLLSLRDERWSYRRLADKFEISKSQARNICKGRKRCQTAVRWKVIERVLGVPAELIQAHD